MSLVRDNEALLCLPLKHTTVRTRGVLWETQNGIVVTNLFSEDGKAFQVTSLKVVESPSLKVFKRHVDVAAGNMI